MKYNGKLGLGEGCFGDISYQHIFIEHVLHVVGVGTLMSETGFLPPRSSRFSL